jgi:TetR/AcrR family transcriptional regulator
MGAPVSASEICARAGVNVAMVKYCFGGKDALLDSLVERVMEQFPPEIERLAQLDMHPADKLRRHVAEIVRNYVRYPYVNRLMNERLLAGNSEAVERMSRAFAIPARNLYRQLLDEGRREDRWREIDPTLFFFMVIGVCEFVFSARPWLEHAFDEPLDDALVKRFINEATELVVRGVGGT